MMTENLKISINYWGMTRSTRFVYKSHQNKLFDILKQNNILFDIYIHTWETDKNIVWDYEMNIPIDYEEYKLLNPTEYKIDKQDDFLNTINFENYFNKELFEKHSGNTQHEWWPHLIKNHLCALESQKRVTEMCINSQKKYDFVIYIRPDVEIYDEFPVNCLLNINIDNIGIPQQNHHDGYNDQCAVVPFNLCEKYGKRLDEILEFKKLRGRIVSEKFIKYIVDKYFKNIYFFNFYFKIIRPYEIIDKDFKPNTVHT